MDKIYIYIYIYRGFFFYLCNLPISKLGNQGSYGNANLVHCYNPVSAVLRNLFVDLLNVAVYPSPKLPAG